MSPCNKIRFNRRGGEEGFTLIEVMFAVLILFVGLSAMAALGYLSMARGRQARYISVAETLATEKLEELAQYQAAAPQICMAGNDTSEGLLTNSIATAQASGAYNVTCSGANTALFVNYYDMVSIDFLSGSDCINPSSGCFSETVWNGTNYISSYHAPDGTIPGPGGNTVTNSTAPSNTTYLRTWKIEYSPTVGSGGATTVNGTRRITVLVTNLDQSVAASGSANPTHATLGPSFQMSLVRQ